ncbi:MAG TPA: alanine racemase [Planctomycetota bacterium]|nr:alanine racemase [Planctomycetota bacterium]
MRSTPDAGTDPAVTAALRELAADGCDELRIGGVPVRQLVRDFGSPLYVFDSEVLRRRLLAVRTALGPRTELLYSLKANPSVAIGGLLRELGVGVEIASAGELCVATAAGFPAAAVRFAGPGKTDAELAAALQFGIGCVHVESADEVTALAAAARQHGGRARIAVRVNFGQQLAGARMRMGGRSSRFGVDQDQVGELVRTVLTMPALQLEGLHVYGGTQCFDAAAFLLQAQHLVDLATQLEHDLGIALPQLDVGGGFGIATYAGDPAFDLAAAGAGLQRLIAAHDRSDRRWLVELGRFLVAPAGVYLTQVVRTKNSGGVQQVILDGGLHHCAAAAGFGTLLRRPALLVAATALRATGSGGEQCLGGPLCTPLDQLAQTTQLPSLRTGDLVAVLHAGAYGLSYSPTGFLGHPTPAEVLVDHGEPRLVRQRGEPADALLRQRW